ncbi:30S ribosomal protein S9 [Candidatus Aenigmatarchaeota archaeon]
MAKKTKKETNIICVGKRKKAVARAVIKKGTGKIRINKKPLDFFDNYKKLRINEAILLAENAAKEVDISVTVTGGGAWGQVDAARTAIANAILQYSKNPELRKTYVAYDRSLLISDPRRTEQHKPSRSSKGPRRGKQQSKR